MSRPSLMELALSTVRDAPPDRPFVVAQLGQSLDGRIATVSGDSRGINGSDALDHLHALRASVDAVVVGVGTVIADDPQLTVRRVSGRHPARVVIDPAGWGGAAPHPEFLEVLFDAVRQDRRVRLDYRALSSGRGGRRLVDPWGLVLAGSTWYLIAAHRGSPHTYRLSRIESLTVLPDRARRPDDLDLVATWRDLRAAWSRRPTRPVILRIRRDQADLAQRTLRMVLVGQPEIEPDAGRDDTVILRGEVTSLRGVVGLVLGFGDWVEAVEPAELRDLMVEIAQEALGVYAER